MVAEYLRIYVNTDQETKESYEQAVVQVLQNHYRKWFDFLVHRYPYSCPFDQQLEFWKGGLSVGYYLVESDLKTKIVDININIHATDEEIRGSKGQNPKFYWRDKMKAMFDTLYTTLLAAYHQ